MQLHSRARCDVVALQAIGFRNLAKIYPASMWDRRERREGHSGLPTYIIVTSTNRLIDWNMFSFA